MSSESIRMILGDSANFRVIIRALLEAEGKDGTSTGIGWYPG